MQTHAQKCGTRRRGELTTPRVVLGHPPPPLRKMAAAAADPYELSLRMELSCAVRWARLRYNPRDPRFTRDMEWRLDTMRSVPVAAAFVLARGYVASADYIIDPSPSFALLGVAGGAFARAGVARICATL